MAVAEARPAVGPGPGRQAQPRETDKKGAEVQSIRAIEIGNYR